MYQSRSLNLRAAEPGKTLACKARDIHPVASAVVEVASNEKKAISLRTTGAAG